MSWPSFHADKYLDARPHQWSEHELNGRVRYWGGRVHVHPAVGEIIEALSKASTLLTA